MVRVLLLQRRYKISSFRQQQQRYVKGTRRFSLLLFRPLLLSCLLFFSHFFRLCCCRFQVIREPHNAYADFVPRWAAHCVRMKKSRIGPQSGAKREEKLKINGKSGLCPALEKHSTRVKMVIRFLWHFSDRSCSIGMPASLEFTVVINTPEFHAQAHTKPAQSPKFRSSTLTPLSTDFISQTLGTVSEENQKNLMKNKKTNLLRIRTPFILTFEVIQVAGGVFCYFI